MTKRTQANINKTHEALEAIKRGNNAELADRARAAQDYFELEFGPYDETQSEEPVRCHSCHDTRMIAPGVSCFC